MTQEEIIIQFEANRKLLNEEQLEAVTTIEGPVMVFAGPGTGKTHVLTLRIGQILLETDTPPSAILCLTFTEAGAKTMRERLVKMLGIVGHQIPVFTFHGFCNMVIQENSDVFGLQKMEPINDLEKMMVIEEIIERLPAGHPFILQGYPKQQVRKLKDLFKVMKSEGWGPNHIEKQAKMFFSSLGEKEEFKYQRKHGPYQKGDLKDGKIEEEKKRLAALVEGAKLFGRYQEKLNQRKQFDFEDMILKVRSAFHKHPMLLRKYQERYLYFLLDEAQDTNGVQFDVLNHLIDFWDQPNVFIVGDNDQSIYEFQGARIKNIEDFQARYQNQLKTIVLKNNYRSSAPILQSVHSLIDAGHRSEKTEALIAKNPSVNKITLPVQIDYYPNEVQATIGVFEDLKNLSIKGQNLEEVAVIFSNHKQVEPLLQLLQKSDIPFQTKRPINVFETPIYKEFKLLLDYFVSENKVAFSGESQLHRILHAVYWDFPYPSILKLLHYQQTKEQTLKEVLLLEEGHHWDPDEATIWERFSVYLSEMSKGIVHLNPMVFIERMVLDSGLLSYYSNESGALFHMEVLHSVFEFFKRELQKPETNSIQDLHKKLAQMKEYNIPLNIEKVYSAPGGILLTTAHSSKGLEFEHVFILDGIKSIWENNKRSSRGRFYFPETLSFSGKEDSDEARRRLFYVAATRCKTNLKIIVPKEKGNKKAIKSIFIDQMIDSQMVIEEEKRLDKKQMLPQHISLMQGGKKPVFKNPPRALLAKKMEQFVLDASSLNAYLYCPLAFYYQYVLKFPSRESIFGAYGNAFHAALRFYYDSKIEGKELQTSMANIFTQELTQKAHYFSKKDLKHFTEKGIKHLENYLTLVPKSGVYLYQTEMGFSNLKYGNISIKGRIDLVKTTKEKSKISLVDFKTGKAEAKKVKPILEKHTLNGNYWRQMMFYKLLFETKYHYLNPISKLEVEFVEMDSKNRIKSFEILTEKSKQEDFFEVLQKVNNSINKLDFFTGCGQKDCKWCDFATTSDKVFTLVNDWKELEK